MDDTFVIILTAEIERFTSHINQVDPCIRFTYETEKENHYHSSTLSFKMHGVRVCHKPHHTLRQHLVRPTDEIADEEKCGVIYNIQCKDCDADYIGKTRKENRAPGSKNTENRYKHVI